MAFAFEKPADPENPKDRNDLPPEGWKYIDANDHRQALFSFPSALFIECVEWEVRERARISVVLGNPLFKEV